MPRYFFPLNDLTDYIEGPEGSELPDLQAAKSEAQQSIRDVAAYCLRTRREFTLWSVRISNDAGNMLFEVLVPDALNEVIPPRILLSSNSDNHI